MLERGVTEVVAHWAPEVIHESDRNAIAGPIARRIRRDHDREFRAPAYGNAGLNSARQRLFASGE
jgi:hypothetical protein